MASREMLEHDSDVIERRLHGLGYRRARVRERRLAVVPNSDDVVVSFVIYQGPQFVVDWVSLRGNLVFSSSELLPRPGLARGLPYTDQAAATDANAILQHYAGDGYVASQVVPHVEEVDGARVVVTYEINEGRRAYVSSIVVLGNARTDEGTVRDYISFQPGVVLKLAELRRTEQRLFETGAFRHVVVHSEVIGQTADGLGEQRAVYVDLDEAKPWLFIYGGGYVSDDGPRGLVELSNVNLFGRLNTVGLQMRASPRQQIARVSYTDPLPLDRPWPLLVALSFTRELKDAFSLYRATTLAQVQYQYKPTSAFFFRYNFEQVRVFDLKVSESELERNDRPVRLGKLSAGFVADNRNNPFDPTRGTYSSVDFTVAANAFGGSENYVRFFGEHQRYHQFPKAPRLTYAGAIKFGVADAYGSSEDLPISERFFGGGARSLRGFRFEQAGPRDPVTNEPVGGDVLLVINNELRFPLFWKVGGAAFSDTGNVFVNFDDFTLENVTETLGFGVRIDTPVGPVRVDFGYLLNPPDGVPSSAVHLSFGQSF
jgi:outer membrane protein insertion porin family